MTKNVYWIYLENLRKSGQTNMYGAAPWVQAAFGVSYKEAIKIVADWMRNYNPADYEEGNDD